MKFLIIGDVVGRPGRNTLFKYLEKRRQNYYFIILNSLVQFEQIKLFLCENNFHQHQILDYGENKSFHLDKLLDCLKRKMFQVLFLKNMPLIQHLSVTALEAP